jgi:hypothetical protein
MRKFSIIVFILALPFLGLGQSTLVIRNVSVVDVKSGAIQKGRSVVISGNRIVAVTNNRPIPKGATIVDGTGKYLMPGLWDMHAHALTGKRYVYTFPLLVANGVTGIREMASDLPMEEVNQIRRDVEDGKLLGPRMGALTYRLLDGPGSTFPNVAVEVSTPEQGRELVRKYKQAGADFIKPYNLLSRDTYMAIADEAKKQNIPLEGHVPFSMTPAEVSELGQRSIEHNIGVPLYCSLQEAEIRKQLLGHPNLWSQLEAKAAATYDSSKAGNLFKLFIRNNTWACPSIIVFWPYRLTSDSTLMTDTLLKYIPKAVRDDWHETYMQRITKAVPDPADRKTRNDRRVSIVGEMYRAGVHIMAGTDMPNPYVIPGFSLHQELDLLVQAGMTTIDALRTATLNPALFLGKQNEFGTVEKGKISDLLLLDQNPLTNISNTRKINAVILNGKVLRRNDLDELLTTAQEQAQDPDEGVIRKLEKMERQAILKSDTVQLSILMSKQIVVQNPENTIVGFQQILNRIRNGKISYSSFERNIEKISFVNGIAVVMGLETLVPQGDTRDAGKTVKRRFTNIWTKEKESWKLTARQATIVSIN